MRQSVPRLPRLYLQPRFHQTQLFAAIVAAGVLLAAWMLYRLRVHGLRVRYSAVLAERNRIAGEIHDTLAKNLAGIASRLAERVHRSDLSPRELEILKLIAKGHSNKEIAAELEISEGTVRVHASNIIGKLGCGDRAQAVAEAFQRGIIYVE